MADIQRADPSARRHAMTVLLVATPIGLLLIWLFQSRLPELERWLTEDAAATAMRLRLLALAVGGVAAVPTLIFAAKFWRQGELILVAGQFPPPGMRVVRDTPIVRGSHARARGRALQIVAVSLVVVDVVFVAIVWYLAGTLAGPGA